VTKLLVTGASGLLGANFVTETAPMHDVTAVSHSHPLKLAGVTTVEADLSVEENVAMVREIQPEWVVHCAAETNVDLCEDEPEHAFRMNRDMARWIAREAHDVQAKLLHISTDAVFDGLKPFETEEDVPRPMNVYGQSKFAGEEAVLQEHGEALIVRTNFFGWNAQRKNSLSEMFLHKLSNQEKCQGFVDVKVKSIFVIELVGILLKMMDAGLSGVYHVLAGNCLSKYDFGVALAHIFNFDPGLIEPIQVDQLGLRAYRPRNLCHSTEKLEQSLKIELPTIEDGIRNFQQKRLDGTADRLRAMAGGPSK
jgi:dTDP-4-dehydrorhamnose reductase